MLRRLAKSWTVCPFGDISIVRSFSSGVHLNKLYPQIYNLVHPNKQEYYRDKPISLNEIIDWKCPNGPDHEWRSSVKTVIKRHDVSKFHSSVFDFHNKN